LGARLLPTAYHILNSARSVAKPQAQELRLWPIFGDEHKAANCCCSTQWVKLARLDDWQKGRAREAEMQNTGIQFFVHSILHLCNAHWFRASRLWHTTSEKSFFVTVTPSHETSKR
jgi:hypothetical protein